MSEEKQAVLKLAEEFLAKAKAIEADPLFGGGQLDIADAGRAIAYRDAAKQLRALADSAASPTPEPPMLGLYREALERLADEDTCILGEGLGGGPQEELHVRASFAAHTLGRDTCGCTDCMVSLGLEPDL